MSVRTHRQPPAPRCALCGLHADFRQSSDRIAFESTNLPGTGRRCTDHDACRQRVRATIAAHVGLAEVCE